MRTPGLTFRDLPIICLIITIAWSANAGWAADYDLDRTEGMNAFGGSLEARQLLARQGFVAAAP
ncbi:MAG TPA: hypothetical protein VN673_02550 [Clostridia bacterium]|nr:hypothetical protein [Clostridia bacterium]